jgi:rhodanese-related sulfurtransferase
MKYENKQNKIFLVGFFLIVLIIVWSLIRPLALKLGNKNAESEQKINAEILKAPLITAVDLFKKIGSNEKIAIIDVRNPNDFSAGHLMHSHNEDLNVFGKSRLETLGVQKNVDVVIINDGNDIYAVAKKTNELIADGYTSAKYLQGGIKQWQAQGYALISSGGSSLDQSKVKKITISDLANDFAVGYKSVEFLDVRDKAAFKAGHIPASLNISLADLEEKQGQISSAKKVVIYGANFEQSFRAAATLFDLNFLNAYVLDGGLDAWKNAGGNVETGD